MFCPKCGSKNKDDAIHCGKCGAKLKTSQQSSEESSSSAQPAVQDISSSLAKPKGKKPLFIGIAIVVVITIVLVVLAFTTCGKSATLEEGTYSATRSSSYYEQALSMTIDPDNAITLTNKSQSKGRYASDPDVSSIMGIYEFTGSDNGNDFYTIKDVKTSEGTYATLKEITSIFGGSFGSSSTFESIEMIIPSGYEGGSVEGNWGFVLVGKASDGSKCVEGVVVRIDEGGTGKLGSIYQSGTDISIKDILSNTNDDAFHSDMKWSMNAPGRYTLSYEGSSSESIDVSLPVKK